MTMNGNREIYDIDIITKIIKALPLLSSNIADSSRHEKILSHLSQFCAAENRASHILINELDAISKIRESLKHDDYRVVSLAIRFFGNIISHCEDLKGITEYEDILWFIVEQFALHNQVVSSPIKFACLEALELMISQYDFAVWFFNTEKSGDLLTKAFKDDCLYVTNSAVKLIHTVTVLSNSRHSLNAWDQILVDSVRMGLMTTVKSFLLPDSDVDNQNVALELIWKYASTADNPKCSSFLIENDLLVACLDLLISDVDRIVKYNVADCLKSLFVNLADEEYKLNFVDHSINKANIIFENDYATSYAILEATISLSFLFSVLPHHILSENWPFLLLKFLVTLTEVDEDLPSSSILEESSDIFNGKLKLLAGNDENASIISQKGFVIEYLITDISGIICSSRNQDSQVLKPFLFIVIQEIRRRIAEPRFVISSLKCIYSAIEGLNIGCEFLLDLNIGKLIFQLLSNPKIPPSNIKETLALLKLLLEKRLIIDSELELKLGSIIQQRLNDSKWDIRDHMLNFSSSLFENNPHLISFAFSNHLPKKVYEFIQSDPEAFIRSTALKTLSKIILNAHGWKYLKTGTNLFTQVIFAVLKVIKDDSEAFVRRSALEFIGDLVGHREYLQEIEESGGVALVVDEEYWRTMMTHAVKDDDWEVRIRASDLLKVLFDDALKSVETVDDSFIDATINASTFFSISGDRFLLEQLHAESRPVREVSLKNILEIKEQLQQFDRNLAATNSGAKRSRWNNKMNEFYEKILDLDIDFLKERSVPEHLYQEALEMDDAMLFENNELNDGNNILTCYDC